MEMLNGDDALEHRPQRDSGVMVFMLKGKFDELQRISILLNKTREEMARDHITRAEVRQDLDKIREHFDSGFERLEKKIDALAARR
jgi:hypothetical protein